MLPKLLDFAIRRVVQGPARSWFFTSAVLSLFGIAKKKSERRELVELENLKPGDKYLIEMLHVTHGEQMKAEKQAKKASKQNAKAQKKAMRKARKAAKRS